jgi:hypothetical protein
MIDDGYDSRLYDFPFSSYLTVTVLKGTTYKTQNAK